MHPSRLAVVGAGEQAGEGAADGAGDGGAAVFAEGQGTADLHRRDADAGGEGAVHDAFAEAARQAGQQRAAQDRADGVIPDRDRPSSAR